MIDACDPGTERDASARDAQSGEEEPRALPVPASGAGVAPAAAQQGALAQAAVGTLPAVQAAAVAASGFVAGAAMAGLVRRRRRRATSKPLSRRARRAAKRGGAGRGPRALELVQIVGSRSLLVDVHLLGSSSER
ncbi:MAG TPA: hypothetical protein VL979_14160 [Solirubrobacteraceae bacterium]|nr:hypothetical protein [Solirubrobacteraceae bacterium]